jgi:multicomponent Na+:H+ antiporter subunit C
VSLVLTFCTAVLFGLGTWLLLQRRLTRIIIGLGLMGHGANLLMMLSGRRRGVAPFIGSMFGERYADPMPQALALTAIVISFGVGALLLALAYRSWQLTGDDLVEDDVEDRRIAAERRDAVDEEVADSEELAASVARADAGEVGPGEEL